MLHIHGTPCGGKREDVARFMAGRHALIPFGRSEDIGTCSEVCETFVLDNGAFTAWTSGNPITDWRKYYEFVDEWRRHPAFEWAIIPDVIDGNEADNDRLLTEWRNHFYHHGNVFGVPVWHLHESFGRLRDLVFRYPRVALGSSGEFSQPGSKAWWIRMDEAMKHACDNKGRPIAKLHGLRMLDPAIFSRLPLASADSTNAVRNGSRKAKQCGCNVLTGSTIIADRVGSHQSAPTWIPIQEQGFLVSEPAAIQMSFLGEQQA